MNLYDTAVEHVIQKSGLSINKWGYNERSLFQQKMITLKNQSEIPRIVREKQLNTDPCIDDVDIKTDNTQGAVKFIVLGLIVGLILGIIK